MLDAQWSIAERLRVDATSATRAAMESKASKRRRNQQHDWRVWPTTAALAMFVLILFAGHASGQTPQTVQPPSDLKN